MLQVESCYDFWGLMFCLRRARVEYIVRGKSYCKLLTRRAEYDGGCCTLMPSEI